MCKSLPPVIDCILKRLCSVFRRRGRERSSFNLHNRFDPLPTSTLPSHSVSVFSRTSTAAAKISISTACFFFFLHLRPLSLPSFFGSRLFWDRKEMTAGLSAKFARVTMFRLRVALFLLGKSRNLTLKPLVNKGRGRESRPSRRRGEGRKRGNINNGNN